MIRHFLGNMIENAIDTYNDAYEEARWDDKTSQVELEVAERRMEFQALNDEIRSRFNRREKYDDDGNLIKEDNMSPIILPNSFSEDNKSWICDKCMAINFGCQTACPECGDIKDEKDEIIE